MKNNQQFPNKHKLIIELLLMVLVFILLVLSALTNKVNAQSGSISKKDITIQIRSNKYIISENSLIELEYTITNSTDDTIHIVDLISEVYPYQNNQDKQILLSKSVFKKHNNLRVLPRESQILFSEVLIEHTVGRSWVINFGVELDQTPNGDFLSEAILVHGFGVNMDIDAGDETIGLNEQREIQLISRLLIDEDAAKDPGTTTITIGGIDIEIQLPATRWEARNLMISCSDLNNNQVFDPFDLPVGVDLVVLCDQDNEDQGRNTDSVLDECEPISTFRDLCTSMGEDDVLCEFPEWSFCYELRIHGDYTEPTYIINATDEYEVWQAIENPAGSGMFDPFVDVTNDISSGNSDQVILNVGTVLPVELLIFQLSQKENSIVVNWQTVNEFNNDYFDILRSENGIDFYRVNRVFASQSLNNIHDYEFTDNYPMGDHAYYRLVQVDKNGLRAILGTRYIELSNSSKSVYVYPNPAYNIIYFSGLDREKQDIEIYDLQMNVVMRSITKGNSLNIESIAPGSYFVRILDTNGQTGSFTKLFVSQ